MPTACEQNLKESWEKLGLEEDGFDGAPDSDDPVDAVYVQEAKSALTYLKERSEKRAGLSITQFPYFTEKLILFDVGEKQEFAKKKEEKEIRALLEKM